MSDELTCDVVVPSYRRSHVLQRCLDSLLEQQLAPREIVVVAHIDDTETQEVVAAVRERVAAVQEHVGAVALVTVDRPGMVRALEAGMRHSRADIVAFTDDDARPHPDWLVRLRDAFSGDNAIAGVGGRDVRVGTVNGRVAQKQTVGRLAWWGRLAGNHHAGVGPARDVHVLKGVNCAYRRSILEQVGYDHRLRGQVEHYNELALGLAIVRLGQRLVYDPAICVDHEEAPRVDGDRVTTWSLDNRSVADAAFNEALALTEHLYGVRGWVYRAWSTLVGHRDSPGIVQAIRFTPTLGRRSWRRWHLAEQARSEARRVAGTHR